MNVTRRQTLGFAAVLPAAAILGACSGGRFDAKGYPTDIRIGFSVLETAPARIAALDGYQAYLEKELGLPVKSFRASGYSGIALAMMNDQVDFAIMGPANYATVKAEMGDEVEAVLTMEENDGSTTYVSVIFVKAAAPFQTLDDLKGRSIAFADPNSASGYLIPKAFMRDAGKSPDSFFGRYIFAGGHEQAISAVLTGVTDAGVTWASGVGDVNEGYSRGMLRRMVEAKKLDMKDIRIVAKMGPIPNGPFVLRMGLPEDLRKKIIDAHLRLKAADKAAYEALTGGQSKGFVPVPPGFYDKIIAIQAADDAARRTTG